MSKSLLILLLIISVRILLHISNNIENFMIEKYSINKYFDKIYVIVLEERRKYITDIMNKYNINPTYVDAVLKKNIDKKQLISLNMLDINNTCEKNKKPLTDGQIACHLSHCKVLSDFLSGDSKNCLIFEDDLLEPKYNLKYITYILENINSTLPNDYDIVFLGKCWEYCKYSVKLNNFLDKCYKPYCRHSYCVSRKGAEKILKMTLPMKMSGDQMIANFIKDKQIIAYSSTPSIFYQNRNNLNSTIGNNFKNFDCMPGYSKSPNYN